MKNLVSVAFVDALAASLGSSAMLTPHDEHTDTSGIRDCAGTFHVTQESRFHA
jgi:hypothetical protein